MKKSMIFILPLLLLSSIAGVSGDYGMMGDGYGMMGGYGMGIVWLLYLTIGAFIFSIIFWSTYRWIMPQKKSRK